nr:uncharacterized protein LOC123775345 isoform X1 [Procambarus clarkii]
MSYEGSQYNLKTAKHTDLELGHFTSGFWNTYVLEDYQPSGHLTCGTIQRNMQVFNENFKVHVSLIPAQELIYWELSLEEKKRRRSARRSGGEALAEANKAPSVIKYKFAISDKEGLLFANKRIPAKILKLLQKALKCKDFKIIELSNSDPVNLLMAYKQSRKRAPGHLKLQCDLKMTAATDDVQEDALLKGGDVNINTTSSVIHQKLGCHFKQIPCIRKVSTTVNNMPIRTEVPALKGFRLSSVNLEVHAPSVFHLFKELGEREVITDIPPWLEKIRTSGKTHCIAKYE